MKYITTSLEETDSIARDLVNQILIKSTSIGASKVATVVGLYGDLGSGKTTLTKSICRTLGVEETVTSPTFVIEKIYPIRTNGRKRPTSNGAGEFTNFIHIDAYRLEKSEELIKLGWNEIISDSKNLILIEWPERVSDIMPEHIKIHLKALEDPNSRHIEIEF